MARPVPRNEDHGFLDVAELLLPDPVVVVLLVLVLVCVLVVLVVPPVIVLVMTAREPEDEALEI